MRLPDPSVSLRHASIRAGDTPASFTIVDEGSTNGTWVGGVKLHPHTPRLVRTGDLVRVGRVWLELRIGATRRADARSRAGDARPGARDGVASDGKHGRRHW